MSRKGIAEDVQERILVLRTMMLIALNVRLRDKVFGGVPAKVKAKRRSLNARQKASRKANRR